MKKKKEQTHSVAPTVTPAAATTTSSSPLPPVGGADALPSAGAPTPPVNDNPAPVNTRKGMRAFAAEVNVAESAVRELRISTLFSEALGAKLGTAQQVADAIEFAVEWDTENKAAHTWSGYTQEQANLGWNYALAILDRLRSAFQAAAATDPAIEKELPNFTKLLGVRRNVALKGAATKRKIKSGEIVVNSAVRRPRPSTESSTQAAPPAAPTATPVATVANGVGNIGH